MSQPLPEHPHFSRVIIDRAIEAIAWARAPKEPPVPEGRPTDTEPALERPACPLCGATRSRTVLGPGAELVPSASRRYLVVRCEVCAVRYTTPRFRAEHKHLAFAGSYPFYARALRAKEGWPDEDLQAVMWPFERRARILAEARPRPGRLLDLGCGDGVFLDLMRRRGYEASGVDFEELVVWHAKERLGVDAVRVADVERDPLPEGPFDAVTMWGLLQLSYKPQRLLEKVRAVMAPDGVLAIGVSNIDSIGARLFGHDWQGLGLPRHLIHFTPRSLSRLLSWSGFHVEGLRFENPRWISAGSVDARLPLPGPVGGLARTAVHSAMQLWGFSPYADTMIALARP